VPKPIPKSIKKFLKIRTKIDLPQKQVFQHGYDYSTKQVREQEALTAHKFEIKVRADGKKISLFRFPEVGPDWIDEQGYTYDAIGPIPEEYYNLEEVFGQVLKHLKKTQFVIVNVFGLGREKWKKLQERLDLHLSEEEKKRVVYVW
jgi:hypothetical protein